MKKPNLKQEDLVEGFKKIGLESGDSLIVHSSLKSLGLVKGGADTVLDALMEVIGPKGNLMFPTFNYSTPLPKPHYDPVETPCRTGAIPEIGRKRAGAIRSLHPTHSVAILGAEAEKLTENHLNGRAFGIRSPIDRLAMEKDGKILLLGVGHTANSTIHVAEEYAKIPKVSSYDPLPFLKVCLPDGRILKHQLDTSCSCSAAFGAAEFALRQWGEIHDTRIGSSLIQLMHGKHLIKRVNEMLRKKADILLCTNPSCKPCRGARQALRNQGRL